MMIKNMSLTPGRRKRILAREMAFNRSRNETPNLESVSSCCLSIMDDLASFAFGLNPWRRTSRGDQNDHPKKNRRTSASTLMVDHIDPLRGPNKPALPSVR